jgi:hypothetical protein
MTDEEYSQPDRVKVVENTYHMKPRDHEKCKSTANPYPRRFKSAEAKKLIVKLLEEKLKGKTFDANEAAQISRDLCTEIKEKVKGAGGNFNS